MPIVYDRYITIKETVGMSLEVASSGEVIIERANDTIERVTLR